MRATSTALRLAVLALVCRPGVSGTVAIVPGDDATAQSDTTPGDECFRGGRSADANGGRGLRIKMGASNRLAPDADVAAGAPDPLNRDSMHPAEARLWVNPNPPVAAIGADLTAGRAPLTVHFDGSDSSDPDGPIARHEWDFDNDGVVDATGPAVRYEFSSHGVYTVRLVVTDAGSATDEETVVIAVASEPTGPVVVDSAHPAWLRYAGGGPFFMCGPGDPEGFLYRGARNADGTRNGDQMALIDKMGGTGANCIYMVAVRTHGGDGADAYENPFVDGDINNPVDPDIIRQWEAWFTAMDNHGIAVYLVLYDDSARPFGYDPVGGRLDVREAHLIDTIVNGFQHHKHLVWCVAEEYSEALSKAHVSKIAERIKHQDDGHHPVAVHHLSGASFGFNGDVNLDQFAVQLGFNGTTQIHDACVAAWNNVGGLKSINLAEFAPTAPVPTGTELRKTAWATAFGGAYGMYLHMDIAGTSVADLETCGRLVRFMEATRFNETRPYDDFARGNTDYVLASPGEVYLAYGDLGNSLGVYVEAGTYQVTWYDPVDGQWVDTGRQTVPAGDATFAKPEALGDEGVVYLAAVSTVDVEAESDGDGLTDAQLLVVGTKPNDVEGMHAQFHLTVERLRHQPHLVQTFFAHAGPSLDEM